MNTLTLKIPQVLDDALRAASARRQISKSAVVREALEKTLANELTQTGAAAGWVRRWRGGLLPLAEAGSPAAPLDERSAHILAKHLR